MIGEIIGDEDADSMIHLTVASREQLDRANGLDPGSIFVRYGDVSHMSVSEFQEQVIQPLAWGHTSEVKGFVIVKPSSAQFVLHWEQGPAGVPEFSSRHRLKPDKYVPLQSQ